MELIQENDLKIKNIKGDILEVVSNPENYDIFAIIELPDFKNSENGNQPLKAMVFNNSKPGVKKGINYNMLAKFRQLYAWDKVDIFICQHAETLMPETVSKKNFTGKGAKSLLVKDSLLKVIK